MSQYFKVLIFIVCVDVKPVGVNLLAINPFSASCSKLLQFEAFSAILV